MHETNMRMGYEVEYQPEYQAVDGLMLIISLHKFLVGKYVKIHKIDQCYLL